MSEINIDELEQAAKAATPGPWRWEFNAEHKRLHLVGGRPQYDLSIMDFDRWGMSGAVATLRDTSEDGMNIMHRLCDRPDWIAPFPGRAHHASWCSDVTHPDMRLIATANPSTILSLIDRVKKAEAQQAGPVWLTDADFFEEIERAGIPVEDVALACAIKDLVQTAVLRANGLNPQAKGD